MTSNYALNDDKAYSDAYNIYMKLKALGLPPLTITQEIELVREMAYMRQEEINELRREVQTYEADDNYHM